MPQQPRSSSKKKPAKAGKKPARVAKPSTLPTRPRPELKTSAKPRPVETRLTGLEDQIAALRIVGRRRTAVAEGGRRASALAAGPRPMAPQALSDAQILAGVIEVVRELTDERPVTPERRLGDLGVPKEPLARRLNAKFFGGVDVLAAEQFNDGQTVGTVAYIVAITLEGQ